MRGLLALAVLGLTGCGGSQVEVAADPPDKAPARLGDKTDVLLADWLKKPRVELAGLVAEWSDTVQKQRLHARENPLSVDLLPDLQPPATMPVFREASFSRQAGFSLPPYARPGEADAALALHLARLGDGEAAGLVAGGSDKDLFTRMDRFRSARNYPL